MTRYAFASLFCLVPLVLSGCLSKSYHLDRDELHRLAALEPESRWQSIRAVQRVASDDHPPADDSALPPSAYPPARVYPTTVVLHSHHRHSYGYYGGPRFVPPSHVVPPPRAAPIERSSPTGPPAITSPTISRSSSKGSGDPSSAIMIAAAVVIGAGTGIGLAATEGARYDGWVSVNPDEPLHLKLDDGRTSPVRLSSLSMADVAGARGATIYEGQDGRFPRLGRAPLDRAGFAMTTAFHFGGVPQIDGTPANGLGGYLHLGGNIANVLTLGLAATANQSVDARHSTLVATIAPEIHVYPLRFVGLYAGGGWSFRNTDVGFTTRADEGWLLRGGAVGEIPITTRLTLQARGGAARHVFERQSAVTWEGTIGFGIY